MRRALFFSDLDEFTLIYRKIVGKYRFKCWILEIYEMVGVGFGTACILVNIFRNRKISHIIRNIIGSGSHFYIYYLTLLEKISLEIVWLIRIITKTCIITIPFNEFRSMVIYIIRSINIIVLPIQICVKN